MKYAKSLFLSGEIVDSSDATEQDYKNLGMVCLSCNEPVILRIGHSRDLQTKSIQIPSTWVHRAKTDLILQEECELRSNSQTSESIRKNNLKVKKQRLTLLYKHIKKIYYTYSLGVSLGKYKNIEELYVSHLEETNAALDALHDFQLLETHSKGFETQKSMRPTIFTEIVRQQILVLKDEMIKDWKEKVLNKNSKHYAGEIISDYLNAIHIDTVYDLLNSICKPSSYELLNFFICDIVRNFVGDNTEYIKRISPHVASTEKMLLDLIGDEYRALDEIIKLLITGICVSPRDIIRKFIVVDWMQAANDLKHQEA